MIKMNNKLSPQKKYPKVPPDVDNPPFYIPLKSFETRYKIISNLGNGSFGSVTLAKFTKDLNDLSNFKVFKSTLLERNSNFQYENHLNKLTGLVAIKTMTERLQYLNDYTRIKEIRFILSIPYHPNLVQIYEMFIDDSAFKLHIVMECMDQNLYQLMKARKTNLFSLRTLKSILSQVLNGIRHIHRCDYFHRDIKPENILVSPAIRYYDSEALRSMEFDHNFIVKIADYGLARHVENKRPYTSYVSTRWYRAPEILLRKNWYSRPVDIWAFGSVATEVATFRPLFPGSDELEQTWKVLEVLGTPSSRNMMESYYPSYGYWDEALFLSAQLGLRLPIRKCIDISHFLPQPELKDLCEVIRACLAWNPDTRLTVEQLCAMPYFRGTCVDDDQYFDNTVHERSTMRAKAIPLPSMTNSKKSRNYDLQQKSSDLKRSKILAGISGIKSSIDMNIKKSKVFEEGVNDVVSEPESSAITAVDDNNSELVEEWSIKNSSFNDMLPYSNTNYDTRNEFQPKTEPPTEVFSKTNDENSNLLSRNPFGNGVGNRNVLDDSLQKSFIQNLNITDQQFRDTENLVSDYYSSQMKGRQSFASVNESLNSAGLDFDEPKKENANTNATSINFYDILNGNDFSPENDHFKNITNLQKDDSLLAYYGDIDSTPKDTFIENLEITGLNEGHESSFDKVQSKNFDFSDELYSNFNIRRLGGNEECLVTDHPNYF